jgi:hypothetical protein
MPGIENDSVVITHAPASLATVVVLIMGAA